MEKEKLDFNDIIDKTETLSDNIVFKVYKKSLVEKVEKLDFMKRLVKSSFIKSLQDFGKGWFKQVFVFFGYVSIIFGVISTVINFFGLFKIGFLVGSILNICLSLISIIVGFGMIKFKRWYPFMVLIQGGFYLLSTILSFVLVNSYYRGLMGIGSISSLLVNIGILLVLYSLFFALVLKNKGLFLGTGVIKTVKKKKETTKKKVIKKESKKKEL